MSQGLLHHAETLAKKIAEDTMTESYGDSETVGCFEEDKFTFYGKEYQINVEAFWEKSNWGEYKLKGIGHDYDYKSEMFYF